jgi:hypothetical protein
VSITFDISMNKISSVLCLILLAGCASLRSREVPAKHTHADPMRVINALSKIAITNVNCREGDTTCAFAYWETKTMQTNPDGAGVSFVLRGFQDLLRPSRLAPGEDPWDLATTPRPEYPLITIRKKTISSLDLLNEICRQADLVWWITSKCIVIEPKEE